MLRLTVHLAEQVQVLSLLLCTNGASSVLAKNLSTKASWEPRFKGVIKEETKIGDYDAVIPMITGTAYLTGVATYIIDGDDPLKYGFLIG